MISKVIFLTMIFSFFSCGTIPKGDLVQRKILDRNFKKEESGNKKISYKKENITVFNIKIDDSLKVNKGSLSIWVEEVND